MKENLVVKTSLGPEKDDELGWGRRIRPLFEGRRLFEVGWALIKVLS